MVMQIRNYIDGEWKVSQAKEYWGVYNPATGEKLGEVPYLLHKRWMKPLRLPKRL